MTNACSLAVKSSGCSQGDEGCAGTEDSRVEIVAPSHSEPLLQG